MIWFVYILQCVDGTLYTGITSDLERRVAEHENGQGAKYTRGRGPFRFVYKEICQTRSIATKREIMIKALDRKAKLSLISANEALSMINQSGTSEVDDDVTQSLA